MAESCNVAFKEWAPIVQALGTGRQMLLLRKGGIAEGPGGFRPEHPRFWLFPTTFHTDPAKLKSFDSQSLPSITDPVGIRYFAEVLETRWLDEPDSLTRLDPYHLWAREELAKRWTWGTQPGLYALIVRVFQCAQPFNVPFHPDHQGCKSWITLPTAPSTEDLQAVMDPATFESQHQAILQALSPQNS
jgi:hypothetical protein